MARTQRQKLTIGALTAGLLVLPLAACTGNEDVPDSSTLSSAGSAASSATSAASSAAEEVSEAVDCSGHSCSVTLDADAAEVEVLGTTISFGGVSNGEATFSVGDREISCAEGDSAEAGPLSIECTTVSEDSVTFTASLG